METENPIMVTKPIEVVEENKELKIIESKTYEIIIDNHTYKIELGKSENKSHIIIKGTEISNQISEYYIATYSQTDFFTINKSFMLYNTLDELYDKINDLMNNKKYILQKREYNLALNMIIDLPEEKKIEVELLLQNKNFTKDEIISNLYKTINTLSDKINDLSNKNNELTNKNNDLINRVYDLLNKNNDLTKLANNLSNKNNDLEKELRVLSDIKALMEISKIKTKIDKYIEFAQSNILINEEDKTLLKEWLSTMGKVKYINMLYSAKRDGDTKVIIEKKMSNYSPTLHLIKTRKGRLFGGFTTQIIDSIGQRKIDNKAFLFSLNAKKIYKILKSEEAIGCLKGIPFMFGNTVKGDGFFAYDYFLTNKSFENNFTKVYDVPNQFELSGENEFNIEDAEIYHIIYEE